MAGELSYILGAVIIVSLMSFLGILTLSIKKGFLNKILFTLVAFATGTLLGTVFFDLIPESIELYGNLSFVLLGLVLFFVIESFIHWHHHEVDDCKDHLHPVAHLNIIGDGLHNFLDGVIIATAFLVNMDSGIAVSIAIILHEIPQEIGDYAILIHSGLSRGKALLFNFLSAAFAIVGGVLGYLFLNNVQEFIPHLVSLAAGGLLYVAASDLLPELHRTRKRGKILIQFIFLILGILAIWFIFNFLSG